MLHVGEEAPDFSLPDQNGETVTLSDLKDKTVVLFFYPKADTPGCTTEACAFRDAREEFSGENAVLLGISPDESKAQLAFAEKYNLPFHLLADTEHKTAEEYGVWAGKSMYGKHYMGIERTTYVIAPGGKISVIFRKVKVPGHSDEVLTAIRDAAQSAS